MHDTIYSDIQEYRERHLKSLEIINSAGSIPDDIAAKLQGDLLRSLSVLENLEGAVGNGNTMLAIWLTFCQFMNCISISTPAMDVVSMKPGSIIALPPSLQRLDIRTRVSGLVTGMDAHVLELARDHPWIIRICSRYCNYFWTTDELSTEGNSYGELVLMDVVSDFAQITDLIFLLFNKAVAGYG